MGAIPAGLIYILDTSGTRMGQSPALLENSPFTTFLIPGLFLLLVNGFGNVAGAIFSFTEKKIAGELGLCLGVILILWIIIQIILIGLISFMQPLMLFIGIIESGLGWYIIRSGNNNKV